MPAGFDKFYVLYGYFGDLVNYFLLVIFVFFFV